VIAAMLQNCSGVVPQQYTVYFTAIHQHCSLIQAQSCIVCLFFEVSRLHGLDQATSNLLHKKIRREDGATCYDTHPTALFPQEMLSQGHAT
jgi:hypothetical protein